MAYESDYLVDRRRLKRRLALWRTMTVLAVIATIAAAYGRIGDTAIGGNFIASIPVEGVIVQDDRRIKVIRDLAENESAKAVILRIDSPGGTVVGGETLYRAVLELAKKKPVVAVLDGVAASAAYMVAIAADQLFAQESTITGSVGVIMQTADVTRLLEMIGVSARSFKSGLLKAVPSPVEPITSQVAIVTQSLIDEMYKMFREMVLERRKLKPEDAARFSDGRVFTGRQALRNGLIDQIGDERAAIAWLESEKGIPKGLSIRKIKKSRDVDGLIERLNGLTRKTILSERLTLDGLISVWHPQIN
jgi:protease-4